MKQDGHIHSPYCPHGSSDSFEQYIEKAILNQFTHITFTEHAPAPSGFKDPVPEQDSFMKEEHLESYIIDLQKIKAKYAKFINVRIGLEVDYIEGFEKQTQRLLNEIGPHLDDSILSVHFLLFNQIYECIDYSPDTFTVFAKNVGSLETVYQFYYDTVRKSIFADLGIFKPIRIGHPTLIHKFQLISEEKIDDHDLIIRTLNDINTQKYQIDFNSAGLAKKYCLEPYPPLPYASYAKETGIPLIFGSDAHRSHDLHQYYEDIYTQNS
ncbi:MAG: histidinol-phosphatase HisJ [Paenisporosarcina sp.]